MVAIPISFNGTASYVTEPFLNSVVMTIPEIDNNTTGTTGSIKTVLWFTSTPYTGGQIFGFQTAFVAYTNVLQPNNHFTPIVMSEPWIAPPAGNPFVTLALEEFDGSSYVIEDYIAFGASTPTPTPAPPPRLTPAPAPTPAPVPVTLHGAASQYIIADNNGSLYIQDLVAGRDGTRTLLGVNEMRFTNGIGVFDHTGAAEDIARIYGATLNRSPDADGLKSWTDDDDIGHVPLDQIATSFTSSPEFLRTYGSLGNTAFVTQLYANVLKREPDAGGLQSWNNALAGRTSRGDVVLGFAESQENKANTNATAGDADTSEAYRLYQAALNRTPDGSGLSFWASTLSSGTTPTQVAQDFVLSAEFQSKFGTLNVSDFVSTMYGNVLHRAADADGLQFWSNNLISGASRASVLVGFSDSLENRVQTAAATHANWVFIPS